MDLQIEDRPLSPIRYSLKATIDVTRCLICGRRFGSDDIRMDVIQDSRIMGVIHEDCYEMMFLMIGGRVTGDDPQIAASPPNASEDREAS